tara:strand:- start:680 stop:1036 length:357 start_codon:yes stop_codon:yes gene_type:complete
MERRVNISYAIDLDGVPAEANKLVDDAKHWVSVLVDDLMDINFSKPLPELAERVHSIRQRLAMIDQRIDDCYAITVGYHQAISQPPDQSEVPSGLPDDQTAQVGELTEKLKELQKAME